MQLLSQQQKNQYRGGASMSTLVWVGMVGAGLIMSSINTLVSNILNATSSNQTTSNKSYSYTSRGSAMIRMSAIPSRSAVNFWV